MINRINATVLFVENFDECLSFYKDIMEFKVKDTDSGFASFDISGHELALMDVRTASKMISDEAVQPDKKGVHRTLIAAFLDNTDEAYEQLKSKGVQFIKAPTTQPWGQRTAYFQDPDGNIWEISHFL